MTETQNNRRFERIRQRLPCVIRDGESLHQGFVTDVSPSGLFVQTRAKLASASQLVIEIDWDGEGVTLIGDLSRVRQSNRSATAVIPAGFGFEIQSAPEAYFQLILAVQDKSG